MTIQLTKPTVRKLSNGTSRFEENWLVVCDDPKCKQPSIKPANNPGDAAQNAKNEGFSTVNMGVGRAMRWHCPNCTRRIKSRSLPNTIRRRE